MHKRPVSECSNLSAIAELLVCWSDTVSAFLGVGILDCIPHFCTALCSWKSDFSTTETDVQNVDKQVSVKLQKQYVWLASAEGVSWSQRRCVGSYCVWPIRCSGHWNCFGRCGFLFFIKCSRWH